MTIRKSFDTDIFSIPDLDGEGANIAGDGAASVGGDCIIVGDEPGLAADEWLHAGEGTDGDAVDIEGDEPEDGVVVGGFEGDTAYIPLIEYLFNNLNLIINKITIYLIPEVQFTSEKLVRRDS